MTANTDTTDFTPPYNITWRTFLGSLDRMASDASLPSVIDRSYLSWMPGSVQTSYLTLCRQFGLIDDDGSPMSLLSEIVYTPNSRPEVVARLLRVHYAAIVELGKTHATLQQLMDLWKETFGQNGETRRKAITFYMQAADFAQIPVSPLWERGVAKASRQATPARRARPRARRTKQKPTAPQSTSTPSDTVVLASGAGTLSISVDIDPLLLSEEDRGFVFGVIDSVHEYQNKHTSDTTNDPEDTTS
ncbi:hypothetical protein A8924_5486 [Saccharopolyspora erythraea NRRL 2338]|uniref:Uncharacterized protein n=2 Tax=Saccharopolyspora erythraea TaxID=1836 RepID=A4FJY0_SACEN|nr:hypothetical protein [Saccharopolyspora erythraea]EQD81586.1 hypothetical protein N599_35350 [Saccharopolyspora erythraea D]PFG97993.1 hypothetical protein A8924_5486 [Saccharopolyspora erythraea NRRL 2338]QRK88119.1 hypothetical protein JQX30_25855 [Saccharopolyspora erythraea]CAM04355.1 hypothetical protein SACE_5102 [Saccharopolyspora erythraea NRRL 2338]